MDYVRVCAIDAGTRNFAFCIVDNTNWRVPMVWQKVDLWAPKVGRRTKPNLQDIIEITHAWCMEHRVMLNSCDVIVLEAQLRKPFIVMNAVIQALFYAKVREMHPMTIGAYFKLPKTREQKKAATVMLCRRYAVIENVLKVDDLADAWMMAVYMLIQRNGISEKELQ